MQVNRKFHPDGGRFIVKQYPEDKEYRRFKVNPQVITKIEKHAKDKGLGPDDLLFELRQDFDARPRLAAVPDPAALGKTEPNDKGRRYDHGTLSAYSAGGCRREYCRGAYALYRRERRADGKDSPRRPRVVDTDGHIPRDWFREHVWKPALKEAGIDVAVQAKHMGTRTRRGCSTAEPTFRS